MGLLDKVTRLIRSGAAAPGDSRGVSSSVSAGEKPSLLKKSMALRAKGLLEKAMDFGGKKSEKPTSVYEDPASFEPTTAVSSDEDFSFDSEQASNDFGDLDLGEGITPSYGEEDTEAPEIDFPTGAFEDSDSSDFDLSDADSEFPSSASFDADPDLGLGLDDLDLGSESEPSSHEEEKPKGLLSKAEEAKEEQSFDDSDLGKAENIQDPFADWVKDAENQANREANRPLNKEQAETESAEFLFDDDSDYSTLPIDLQIASRKKLENYLSVFEISKEISASKDFPDFFQNLCYSIQGQIGAEGIAIFSSTNGDFHTLRVVEAQGINAHPNWNFETGDECYQAALKTPSVIYAKEMFKFALPGKEKEILEKSNAELLVPIRNYEEFFGIIVLTKTIEGDDYTIEDLEFLKIVGEMAGSVFRRIMDLEALQQENERLGDVVKANERILSTARNLAQIRDMDEAYDFLVETFKKELGLRRWSFLILDRTTRKEYKVFGTNLLTPDTAGKFRLPLDSNLVGIVANVPGVFRISNFRKNPELLSQLSNDELGLMHDFDILPFLNLNWLVGMLVIHETEVPWTDSDRETAVGISEVAAPVLSNLLMLEERDAVFRDPFSPVETRIDEAIARSAKLGAPFSLTVFKVQNATRMVRIKGAGFFAYYCEELRASIQENLSETDYCYRVGQGKYVVVLDGKDREETQIVVRKIRNRIVELDRKTKDFQTSTANQTLCYPADTREKERMLELIEES
ncbi:GAF domain-containing protein [Leptospira wolffii]|uniref:GAF domain-containing protein n=1 Tax=Leptospira wolffii TaxID=409998 RepID=UPI00108405DC|nr:GAF domain-containing protein [Leptospira wolffii]TGK55155.1 GAF domain-containing protein [Leptospira wolffii]TGK70544.1 GAF domain-containing protein [Leptospira wolffii]TGK77608.1 GAF domain-containing protein [Leptospira wolffii]TGL29919.1 GAF domain-containing protein [Leptospira wolffii]